GFAPLRVRALSLPVCAALFGFRPSRRGRTARFPLVFAVAIAVGVAAVAVSPSIVYAVRDRLGIPADRLSGLVVALVIVTGVQMLMLLWVLGRLDASRRVLDHTFAAVALHTLDLPPRNRP